MLMASQKTEMLSTLHGGPSMLAQIYADNVAPLYRFVAIRIEDVQFTETIVARAFLSVFMEIISGGSLQDAKASLQSEATNLLRRAYNGPASDIAATDDEYDARNLVDQALLGQLAEYLTAREVEVFFLAIFSGLSPRQGARILGIDDEDFDRIYRAAANSLLELTDL